LHSKDGKENRKDDANIEDPKRKKIEKLNNLWMESKTGNG
jgi:hypothetical protein